MIVKKSYLVVGGAALGVILLMYVLDLLLSGGAVSAADDFLAKLSQGKPGEAYLCTSAAYRTRNSEKRFTAQARRWRLKDFRSVAWNAPRGHETVLLSGMVKTKGGTDVPLLLRMTKETGQWKVADVEGPPREPRRFRASGAAFGRGPELRRILAGPRQEMPSTEDLRRLTTATLLDLNQALHAEDFAVFHSKLAKPWQQDISPNSLKWMFKSLGDQRPDLASVREAEPRFRPKPSIDQHGHLSVRGVYPAQPDYVDFDFHYWHDGATWRLAGFWVGVRSAPDEDWEESEELEEGDR
jgi:hypothetical protein